MAFYELWSGPSPYTKSALVLNFPASRSIRNKFLLFTSQKKKVYKLFLKPNIYNND